jgi:hypothetical protein
MQRASAPIVAMIDSDVLLPNRWHARLLRHLRDPDVAAAMGSCIYGYGCPPLQRLWEHRCTVWQEQWGCHNVLFNRAHVLSVGNFNPAIRGAGEDLDLYRRLRAAGYRWVWDKDVVVHHRLDMLAYLRHNLWWQAGMSAVQNDPPITPFQLGWRVLNAVKSGLLTGRVHPILALYLPLVDTLRLLVDFKVRRRPRR